MAARRAREADPPSQIAELSASLPREGLARGYVLRGDERYFREQALDLLRGAAEEAQLEVALHDGERGNPDFRTSSVIDDLSSGGLFSSRRFVCIRNPEDHLKKVEGRPSALARAVEAFVSAPEDPGCIVLAANSLRADHSSVKAIKGAGGKVLSLRRLYDGPPPWNPDPRQAELVQWLQRRGRDLGVRLTPDQAVYLAAATGNELFELEARLERLRSMPDAELAGLAAWTASSAPWTVAERIVEGDLPRALMGVETLFHGGFREKDGRRVLDAAALGNMLVASLVRGVRQALGLAAELARGASQAEALREAGAAGPPAAQEAAVTRARSRPLESWREMLESVSDLERAVKSGVVDANDFARFATRWRVGAPRSRREPAGGRRREARPGARRG